ncbi:MBL fold metallo-hydrolase [Aquihabitans sp. G128]|uniref:alkyl sulfatase dimerization domain-containing protein n=1 Tax=Aquihabitans sp. G128 TaxID=2849779 RepID=UPI001C242B78|nr:alkyl sulfatase dimerization domain-containing protein [Aquihabitans sp. G128]QXC61189.1 MBL fold metallo-hydrolase [Aquihabitans sp. G128]
MGNDGELLGLSGAIVDAWSAPGGPPAGAPEGPTNRVTNELSELADGIAVVESFSHVVAFRTDEGLVLFDASSAFTGRGVTASLRAWSDEPVHSLVYTHGHVDHVGGSGALLADGAARGHAAPHVVGHENVAARFDRYRETNGWNLAINARQFGPGFGGGAGASGRARPFLPDDAAEVTEAYRDDLDLSVGGLDLELHHARGETDDHTWAWIPAHRAVAVGDFVAWVFPNAGNPQKVQRYPGEWAAALREMIAKEPELLLPAHGLPVAGRERVATVLGDLATALERLVADVVGAMNQGATLDEIVHSVRVADDLLHRPWLRPVYDEPEFVVRNIWRLYGGWWDGDPAELKPAQADVLAVELADLAGGAHRLAARAEQLSESGDHRLACHLVELATRATDDDGLWRLRARLYRARAEAETSLMAKGVFNETARASDDRAED